MLRAIKTEVNSRRLAVLGVITRDYLPLADNLAAAVCPRLDFAGRDMLPLLVLLPTTGLAEAAAVNLAVAMEFSYLAGRVHDLNTESGSALSGHAILVGDYLYALAAVRLNNAGYDNWLDKTGRVLARRSEARIERLAWDKRAYVTDDERLAILPKEHAEAVALAAQIAADAAGMAENEKAAYAEFGYYLGILQAMQVYACPPADAYVKAACAARQKAEAAIAGLPVLAPAAVDMLLKPLLGARVQTNALGYGRQSVEL